MKFAKLRAALPCFLTEMQALSPFVRLRHEYGRYSLEVWNRNFRVILSKLSRNAWSNLENFKQLRFAFYWTFKCIADGIASSM